MSLHSLLRHARRSSKLSQLQLALRLDVSSRHVSFVESGRAKPSKTLLLAWLREVEAGASLRNAALLNAGYTTALDPALTSSEAAQMARTCLSKMLRAHNPCPALVFDADWIMLELNEGGQWLCSVVMPELWRTISVKDCGMDMIRAVAHPHGLLSHVRNARAVGLALLQQLRVEQWARPTLKSRVDELTAALTVRFGDLRLDEARAPDTPELYLEFQTEHGLMSFLALQSVFALPQDVTVSSLRTEMWFPADERTRNAVLAHAPA